MMKALIVTVFDSINCGSYWQAKALEEILSQIGCEVYFLKRCGHNAKSTSSIIRKIRTFLMVSAKSGFKAANKYIQRLKDFNIIRKDMKAIDLSEAKDMDFIVLGSDTIWNLESDYFADHRKVFWGGAFADKKIISYGGSVANTTFDTLKKFPELGQYVNSWRNISVRDKNTFDLLSGLTEKEIFMVCDPTLLMEPTFYSEKAKVNPNNNGNKYIFLYLFKPLSKKQSDNLRIFATKRNLKIIQGAGEVKFDNCDSMSVNSPNEFIKHMANAEYVVTDTFHGTIFSILFNRQMCIIERNKNKIFDILDRLNLTDRMITEDSDISAKLCNEIDYASVNELVELFRRQSEDYLKDSIREDRNEN